MDDREGALVKAFVTLADTLVDDYDVVEFAQVLVEDCVTLLDADTASLLLDDLHGGMQVLASTTEQARTLELLQIQSDAGPCLQAYRTGQQVLVEDLSTDTDRWTEFAIRCTAEGFRAVFAIPLRLRNERIGALNLFRRQPGMLAHPDLLVAQALADVATIGILHQRVLTRGALVNSQLQTALNSRIVIEQAKGVLAERGGLDMEQAFRELRAMARNSNRHLSDTARMVIQNASSNVVADP
ncbi:MAG TPA: GAF and ANTAR domain-containing protein [Mycobacterium sp.]|nr:GAF and ANTAR domain-containing protein [Mycobacterium sp.]